MPHRFALPNCAQTYVKMVSKADAKMIASSARNSELKAEFLKLRSETVFSGAINILTNPPHDPIFVF